MKSRKKFLKRLFIFSLVLAVVSAAYVEYGLLPGRARSFAIEKLQEITGKKIAFEKALYLPFHGFIFYNLAVANADASPLFSAKRLALDIQILPFFRDKKIVINNVYLDTPVYDLTLSPHKDSPAPTAIKTEISGQIDVPVVPTGNAVTLDNAAGGPDSFLPENVYIQQIQISSGTLTLRPTETSLATETLRDIQLRINFEKPPLLAIEGSLSLGKTPYASAALSGFWDLEHAAYEFLLRTQWQSIPEWLIHYQKNNFFTLKQGRLKLESHLRSVGEEKALFSVSGSIQGADTSIRSGQYRGDLRLQAKGLFNFWTRRIERYKGNLELLDVAASNLSPKISELHHLAGKVDFEPDLLSIQSLQGQYQGIPFKAQGSLRSFQELLIDGQIFTQTSLEKMLSLIPDDQKNLLKNYRLQGDCEAVTTIHGPLQKTEELLTEHKLRLKNASIHSFDKKIGLSSLSCEIFSSAEGLSLSQAHFIFQKKSFEGNLFAPKDKTRSGRLTLKSDDFSLRSDYKIKPEGIFLEKSTAALKGIDANFEGLIETQNQNRLNIQGRATIDLLRATNLLPTKNEALKQLGLQGVFAGDFRFRGPWDDLSRADLDLKLQGDWLRTKSGLRAELPAIELGFHQGLVTVDHFLANAYGGRVGLKGRFDLRAPQGLFDTDFYLGGLDLSSLVQDLKLENKKLAGTLTLQSTLKGVLGRQETFTGAGSIGIKSGFLWETSQFKAMGNLPLVRVEGLDLVQFREMAGNFTVRDKKVWTNNLLLSSDTVRLTLRGSIDFAQNLNMLMDIEYTNAVFLGAQDAGGLVPLVVNQAANLISQYRLSGTLKKPQYDKAGVL